MKKKYSEMIKKMALLIFQIVSARDTVFLSVEGHFNNEFGSL